MKKLTLLLFLFSILSCTKKEIEEKIIVDSPILDKWQHVGHGGAPHWDPITNGVIYEFFDDGTYERSNAKNNYRGEYNILANGSILVFYTTNNRLKFTKEAIFFENNNTNFGLVPMDYTCFAPCSNWYKRIQ